MNTNGTTNQAYGDKEQMNDFLAGEKYLASTYNAFLSESATPEVVCCLTSLLSDTHNSAQRLFGEMSSRGWYPTPKAQDTKLTEAKQKFGSMVGK